MWTRGQGNQDPGAYPVQPLVENAIKHGVAASEHAGVGENYGQGGSGSDPRRRAGQRMRRGNHPTGRKTAPGMGLGLENVSKRLQLCYGDESDLTFEPGPQETTVQFSIPIRLARVRGQMSFAVAQKVFGISRWACNRTWK